MVKPKLTTDSSGETVAEVIPLPGAGPYAGQTSHRAKIRKRKDREILLVCLEEHQRALAYYAAEAAWRTKRIAELMAGLRKLDGYREFDWGPDPRPCKERE